MKLLSQKKKIKKNDNIYIKLMGLKKNVIEYFIFPKLELREKLGLK